MNIRNFPRIVMVETLLFPVQFLLGMAVNLFITIPDPIKPKFFDSVRGVLVDLHVLNGLTIITLAIIIMLLTKQFKTPIPFRFSIFAMLSIILAIAGGVVFLFLGQVDAFSYTMSIGFAGAVVIYFFMGRAVMQAQQI
jgi:hypothetical protein